MHHHAAEPVRQYLLSAHPLAPRLRLESYNNAAIILDVDGGSWSDRLSIMLHFPSPIIKQVSSLPVACCTARVRSIRILPVLISRDFGPDTDRSINT